MPIVRHQIKDNFTIVPNEIMKDRNMSLKAKGMLIQMLTLGDDWSFSVPGLCAITGEKKDSVNKCLNEIENAGYLRRELTRKGGRINGYEWFVSDTPIYDPPKRRWKKKNEADPP